VVNQLAPTQIKKERRETHLGLQSLRREEKRREETILKKRMSDYPNAMFV
jgi:hypothetical protein